jgi:hypothetical protein
VSRLLDLDLRTGAGALDRYLDEGYTHVRGMSSRFAGAISAWLMLHQSQNGIEGDFVEIGAFQGRYFIALALALKAGERATTSPGRAKKRWSISRRTVDATDCRPNIRSRGRSMRRRCFPPT